MLCVGLIMTQAAIAQEQNPLFKIKFAETIGIQAQARSVPDTFYLAPELSVTEEANIELLGQAKDGEMLYSIAEPQQARTRSLDMVESVEKADVQRDDIKPIQLIVGFASDADPQEVEKSLVEAGFSIVPRSNGDKFSKRGRFFVVEVRKDDELQPLTANMVRALRVDAREEGVTSATLNYEISIPEPAPQQRRRAVQARPQSAEGSERCERLPDDPMFARLWGMRNVEAPRAWGSVTSSSVVVAVIDSGVAHQHPDLLGAMWINAAEASGTTGVDDDGNGYVDNIHGYDFANNDGDPMDDNAHGTHVAGTVGAVADDVGVVGMCWDIKIMRSSSSTLAEVAPLRTQSMPSTTVSTTARR